MTRRSIARAAVAMGVTLGLGLGAAGSAAAQELAIGGGAAKNSVHAGCAQRILTPVWF